MKKFVISIFCFALSFCCFSQVILIDQVIFEPGDNISVVFTDSEVNEGSSGENVVWDFSTHSGTDTITWRGIDPVDYELAQQLWPDSDLGSIIPAPTNDTIEFKSFEFYDFDNQSIATLGSISVLRNKATNEMDTQIVNYSSNPFEEFKFPLEYLDEFESDYKGIVTSNFQGIDTETRRGGDVIMNADATGTILTPTGTYNNVIRVKRIETRYDTTAFEVAGQIFETIVKIENTLYDWLQPERKFALFRIIYTTINYPGVPPQEGPPVAFYTIENGTTNINEKTDPFEVVFFPNPTSNNLTIDNFNLLNIKEIDIYNSSGRRVRNIKNPTKTIELLDLQSGNYFIKLQTDLGTYTQHFLKI